MVKITHAQYLEMLLDPDTPDEVVAAYSILTSDGSGAFDPVLMPDPARVEMTPDQVSAENAMKIGNGIARWRRARRFEIALTSGDTRPVLVAEGDSWFQFPVFIEEVIDHLGRNYLISCISAAGDTAQNMIHGPLGAGRQEYMQELSRQSGRVRAFLLSAAGNDIIGEDTSSGSAIPVLTKILKNPGTGSQTAADYIHDPELDARVGFLQQAYLHLIGNIRQDARFAQLPIILHGYDVPFPYPAGPTERRNPRYAAKNQWLGSAFDAATVPPQMRRAILAVLIDRLYQMLDDVAAGDPHVHVVDCRGVLPDLEDWADEIHATSLGFTKIAARFRSTLLQLGIGN